MKTYAVTGASSGIGQAVTSLLKAQGNSVITVDIREADINVDLSTVSNCDGVVEEIKQTAPGGLDGFIPCAGLGPEIEAIELIALVNYFAAVQMVEGLRDALKARQGAVVLIGSNSSQLTDYDESYMDALLSGDREKAVQEARATIGQRVYGGGKHALCRWMRRNSASYAQDGIRINAIAPGFTVTNMTAAGLESEEYGDAIREFVSTIPVGRPGQPEDQANAALFLLSENSSFICGSVLFVDGGHDAMFRPENY